MLTLLMKWLAPNADKDDSPENRLRSGMAAALLGIILNLILFVAKLAAGLLSDSIAVTADAVNSLSDAASSVVTLVGFRIAGRRPDPSHPFGHGRVEYVSGLIVSMLIILLGTDLFRSSLAEIASPEPVTLSPLTAAILIASIGVKLYMCLYNRALGRRIDSAAVRAASMDSLGDMLSTTAVLAALAVAHFTGLRIDGWAGLAVSLFILYGGVTAARDTISPLLGEAPSKELVKDITREVMSGKHVIGLHDIVVHDYGPGRRMISLHAEVPADRPLLDIHDEIDEIERALSEKLHGDAVIHIDPVATDDPRVPPLRDDVTARLQADVDPRLTVHDFRVLDRAGKVCLLFDVVAPYDLSLSDDALTAAADRAVSAMGPQYQAIVRIDKG